MLRWLPSVLVSSDESTSKSIESVQSDNRGKLNCCCNLNKRGDTMGLTSEEEGEGWFEVEEVEETED